MKFPKKPPERSVGGHMLHGSAWTIASRWSIRSLGVISTLFVARLLTPQDFGIVAMAMLVVGFFEILSSTGQRLAIIRHPNPTRDHYDTAWTLSIIMGGLIGCLILLAAPVTEIYFDEPRAVFVMQVLALRALINGFENIGTVDFIRNIEFNRSFQFNVYSKIGTFLITLALAAMLRNYWALVIAMIASSVLSNFMSYFFHPYRPRLSLAAFREIWSFSLWTFLRALGAYISNKIDLVMVGGFGGTAAMGRYTVAKDVASLPTTELNAPMVSVLYPVMAKMQHDPIQIRALYLNILAWSATICGATAVGIALVSKDFVYVILGEQWVELEPLLMWLSLTAGIMGLSTSAYSVFDMLGIPRRGAMMQWSRVLLLLFSLAPAAYLYRDAEVIAIVRLAVAVIVVPGLFVAVGSCLSISAFQFVWHLWRPFAGALVMAGSVLLLNNVIESVGAFRLFLDVGVGAVTYILSLLLLWHISGRPESPEKNVVDLIRSKITRVV